MSGEAVLEEDDIIVSTKNCCYRGWWTHHYENTPIQLYTGKFHLQNLKIFR